MEEGTLMKHLTSASSPPEADSSVDLDSIGDLLMLPAVSERSETNCSP